MKKNFLILIILFSTMYLLPQNSNFFLRGTFYQDWMSYKNSETDFYHRISSRLELTLWNKRGNGWTVSVDLRNRSTLGEGGKNQFIMKPFGLAM